MDEEAGFIAALLADPGDRTVLLVYADWLDDRNDPRGEYLRLLVAAEVERGRLVVLRGRLAELHRQLDSAWVWMVANRHFRPGIRVAIHTDRSADIEGTLVAVTPDWRNGVVRIDRGHGPVDVEKPLPELDIVGR